ncbi:hypothetical protein EHQ92_00815 [Leptospira biflexa]|uniref:hypothetical protein n=1 Tax=Leptospira biflexa TaxID=172 RepID=UPI001091768E|nr:hypothetical protein [Leptospira biflexa]TGM46497.1 hypothetical protein EHQ92_00815 [Leptospira biflexa]TGM51041.1 hypothetical protein EHQ88_12270 [Leptospira biflexa]
MKQILRYLFFSLFIIQPILSEVKPVPPGPPKEGYYIITYKNTGINLEILANGYVVRSGESIEDSSGQADINYWVIPGTNIIKIRLTERKRTKKDQTNFPPEAEVKLILGQKGQFPDEGILLQQYQWNQTMETKIGEWIEISFDPLFIPPSTLWKQAETLTLTSELESSAISFLKDFTKILNTKDAKKILLATYYRGKDTSEVRYYPYNETDELKSIQGMTKTIGSTWKFNLQKNKFRLVCNQQILEITDHKGEPVITSKKGASIPIYLSRIDGKWVIVR